MIFAAPLWLLALVPWAALAVWMFMRRRPTTAVSFLPFWPVSAVASAKSPTLGMPPAYLILILLAIALSLFGGAKPQLIFGPPPAARHPPSPLAELTYLAAVDRPRAQVMLRIRTRRFDRTGVDVTVESGAEKVSQHVMVTPDGTSTAFVDLSSLASTVTASIPGGSTLSTHRSGKPITIAPASLVPPALQRMIDIYRKQISGADRDTVAIFVGTSLADKRIGIVLAASGVEASGPLVVVDDPVTRDVDWLNLAGGCLLPTDWTPLVYRGRSVLVARRERPTTQIVASIATADWAKEASFVVFWSNVLRELAGGDGRFSPAAADHRPESSDNSKSIQPKPHDLSPAFFLGAIALLLVAALIVPRSLISYTAGYAHQAPNSHR